MLHLVSERHLPVSNIRPVMPSEVWPTPLYDEHLPCHAERSASIRLANGYAQSKHPYPHFNSSPLGASITQLFLRFQRDRRVFHSFSTTIAPLVYFN